jgi:hypothetical protein
MAADRSPPANTANTTVMPALCDHFSAGADPAHPQQGHLDVIVDDPDHLKAVGARAEDLGATRLADGATWITLADPGRPSVRPVDSLTGDPRSCGLQDSPASPPLTEAAGSRRCDARRRASARGIMHG